MTKAAKKKDLPVYDFSLVLPKDLNNVWEDCKNILEKSIKRSGNRVRDIDVYYRIYQNICSLWIIFDKDTLDIIEYICLIALYFN